MILDDFAMIAADTARSKAYIQAMIWEKKFPAAKISTMEKMVRQILSRGCALCIRLFAGKNWPRVMSDSMG